MTALLAIAVLGIVGSAYFAFELVTQPIRQRRASIERATSYAGAAPVAARRREAKAYERAFGPVMQTLAAGVTRISSKTAVGSIDRRLLAAGLGGRMTSPGFLALKGALGICGFALGVVAGSSFGSGWTGLFLGLSFGAGLFIVPDRVLASRARSRRERLEADLPDALDLLAISVEAGLSLDSAMMQLVEHGEGPLIDELAVSLGEMRIGQSRQDALRKLGERTGSPAVNALARAIIQSDQLGMSLGRILRIQSQDARQTRQVEAEERANKLPVKMIFPTLVFILPALFIVVLVPAFISLFKVL